MRIRKRRFCITSAAVLVAGLYTAQSLHAATEVQVDWSASIPELPGRDAGPGHLSGSLGVFDVNAAGDTFPLPADGTLTVDVSGFSDGFPNGNLAFTRNFSNGPPALQFLTIGSTAADISVNFVDLNTGLITDFPFPCTVNGVSGNCFVSLFDNTNTGTDEAAAILANGSTRPSFAISYRFTVLSTGLCGAGQVMNGGACITP
jgi:hypothetical protein